jgi:NitT/TauT family transport system substrate-binding protein
LKKIALATLLALLFVACHEEKKIVPRAKVRLNLNDSLSYAPLMIAYDEGFFADEGIDAELVELDSNSAVTAAAVGKLDVLSVGVRSGVFNLMRKGVPLRVVADRGHSEAGKCFPDAFIAPKATVKAIEAAGGDLRGQRMTMTRGGLAEFLTLRLLAQHGRTTNDVTMLQMPQGSSFSPRGELDAVRYVSEPVLSHALSEGWAGVVATSESVAPGHQNAILVYGKRLLRDDPELGRRFMRAYLRGVRRFNEGKNDRNVAILASHTKLTPEIIKRACWMSFANDGHIDVKNVQPFLDWALEQHYLDGPIDVSQWWNPSYLPAR